MLDAKRALFVGAHTDDEMICAGTLRRLVNRGVDVGVVTFCPAGTREDRRGGQEALNVVLPEWERSMDTLGVKRDSRILLGWSPVHLPAKRQDVCQFLFDLCEETVFDLAFVLSRHDENEAHAIVGEEAERVMRGRVATVIRCNFPWNYTTAAKNLYVRLTPEEVAVKRKVIECYQSQTFRYGYGEMLEHYVHADGLAVKQNAAETFEIIRAVL